MTKYAIPAGGNWGDDTTWSTTSGGTNDTVKPTAADDVILDGNAGNVVLNVAPVCRSLNCDASGHTPYAGTLTHNGSVNLDIGDGGVGLNGVALQFSAGMTYSRGSNTTSVIRFVGTNGTQQTFTTAGKTISAINFTGFSSPPNIRLMDNLTMTSGINQNGGHFNVAGRTVNTPSWGHAGANTRQITVDDSTRIELTGTSGTLWAVSGSALTINGGGNFTIVLTAASASNRTLNLGTTNHTRAYGVIDIRLTGSTGKITIGSIHSSNTIKEILFSDPSNARTLEFTAGQTYNFTGRGIVGDGASGRLLVLQSTGAAFTLSKSSGIMHIDWWNISNCTGSGGATFYVGSNSTNSGGNTGLLFNTFYDMNLNDSLTLNETLIKETSKSITDTVSFVEFLTKKIDMIVDSSISLVESFTYGNLFFRNLTDTVTYNEILIKRIEKTFTEIPPVTYLLTEDGQIITDEQGNPLTVNIGRGLNQTETFTKTAQFYRSFTEQINLIERFRHLLNGLKTFYENIYNPQNTEEDYEDMYPEKGTQYQEKYRNDDF